MAVVAHETTDLQSEARTFTANEVQSEVVNVEAERITIKGKNLEIESDGRFTKVTLDGQELRYLTRIAVVFEVEATPTIELKRFVL